MGHKLKIDGKNMDFQRMAVEQNRLFTFYTMVNYFKNQDFESKFRNNVIVT
jgi:hypothetical protein